MLTKNQLIAISSITTKVASKKEEVFRYTRVISYYRLDEISPLTSSAEFTLLVVYKELPLWKLRRQVRPPSPCPTHKVTIIYWEA